MSFSTAFLIIITSLFLARGEASVTDQQNYRDEIQSLLKSLCPVEVDSRAGISLMGKPSDETQQYAQRRLFEIAIDSDESRLQVVEALTKVVENGSTREGGLIAHRWTMAVDLLGDLRATEAIDTLVKNINDTGTGNMVLSIHYHPVSTALLKIGEPAIPRLIEALSDQNGFIRSDAASTLAGIGQQAVPKLKEALLSGNCDTRVGAAWALAIIGGDEEARTVLEHAISVETDEEALSKMKEDLKYWRWK